MSRFFHGGGSDSDSSSSDEEELISDLDEEEKSEEEESSSEEEDSSDADSDSDSSEEEGKPKKTGANIFLKDDEDESEESEDEAAPVVVKSAKDKRLQELEGTVKLIENAERINDWTVISAGEFCEYFFLKRWGDWADFLVFRIRQVEPTDYQDHSIGTYTKGLHQGDCRSRGFHERGHRQAESINKEAECKQRQGS